MRLHLLLAVAANAIIIISSTDTESSSSSSESISNESNSSSESYGSSSSNVQTNSTTNKSKSRKGQCKEKQRQGNEKCGKHEMFVDCPDALCQPQTCEDLGYDLECTYISSEEDCPSEPGCVCEYNYVRNSEGRCIPSEKCHSCGGDENAVSGCGINCGRLCSNYKRNDVVCIDSCMTNGCDCKEGYVLDDWTNTCVRPEQCTTTTCNKPNEIYDVCPAPCPPRRCDVNDALILCAISPQPGDPDCEPGCRCADGYAKNASDICIPREECPTCPNPNEVYDFCPATCPPRRCDVDDRTIRCAAPLQVGDPGCKPGCRCADGYYRNDQGICVTRKECNDATCGINEEYSDCPAFICRPENCTQLGYPVECPATIDGECPVQSRCVCKAGYLRNSEGVCVSSSECPACGGDPNARIGCGINCGRLCSNYFRDDIACIQVCYDNACDCRDGFVYDSNTKTCVLPEQCTPICGQYEVYSSCINGGCDARNCSQLGKPVPCKKIRADSCIKGCVCQDGYLRDDNGDCVPENECPQICTGQNEIYDSCSPVCPPQNCRTLNLKINCLFKINPEDCKGSCQCKPGYYRNSINQCISKDDCLKCTGPHEYFSCGGACDNVCATLREQNQTNCPIVNIQCNSMCYCEEGYARDGNNTCIPIDQCKVPQCGIHEKYIECKSSITVQNCSQLGSPIAFLVSDSSNSCPDGPGCVCEDGYLRDDQGVCIPQNECPSCGGDPNAQSGCGGYCGRKCSTLKRKGPLACPAICRLNACDCKPGYVFDDNIGKCVLPEQCTPTCGNDEVYSDCINGGCRQKNCTQIGKPIRCPRIPADRCIKGCLCKDGYLRAENDTCIPQNQCPETCLGLNEVYDPCPPTCPPQTCASINSTYHCPMMSVNQTCSGSCRCKSGYFRNKKNQCLTSEDCSKCTGPNEYFACGGACDNVCSSLSKQNQTNCPIVNIVCNRRCYCDDGYARDEKNICVPIDQCKANLCGNHEVYSSCVQGSCKYESCAQLGKPIACPRIDPAYCVEGCLCEEGYLRANNGTCIPQNQCPVCGENEIYNECPNSCEPERCSQLGYPQTCDSSDQSETCPVAPACVCDNGYARDEQGRCIPSEQCPSCGGDPSAVAGCGVNCKKHCSDLSGRPRGCIRICYPNACDCRDGYYFDANIGKCVKPENCSPICENNEVYSDCIQSNCKAQSCSQLGQPIACPAIDPAGCIKGCLCQDGYVRSNNGTCIPQNQCPTSCGGDPNALPGCGQNCGRRCSNYNKGPVVCVLVCKENGCDCKEGYVLDDNTKMCVLPSQCTTQCEQNERYVECPSCQAQACSEVGFPLTCSRDPESCYGGPGCICDDGYVRNDQGKCIPVQECPSCGGDPNAVSGCGVNCYQHCSDIGSEHVYCGDICYLNSCDCRKGYFYDNNLNRCVKAGECTSQCGSNEKYVECPSALCEPQSCSDIGFPVACIDLGDNGQCPDKPGCVCVDGYVRDDTGNCVPEQECHSCGGDPNAEPGCGVNCNKRCSDYNKEPQSCILSCNTNGCDCKAGYYFDDNLRKCVLPEDCTPECGVNEMYHECPANSCQPQDCSQLGFSLNCTDLTESVTCPGRPGCVCQPGYVRDIYGKCMPARNCPSCGGDPNAVAGCGVNCNKHCSNIGQEPGFCILACFSNACDCRDGYYYDDNLNECVLPEDCTPTCGVEEVYSDCVNGGCEIRDCSQLGQPILCIDPIECFQGCVCRDGYLRTDDGTCVPENECQLQCTKPHEVFDPCPPICPPQTCDSLYEKYSCPFMPVNRTAEDCHPACRCEPGYYRNINGDCISGDDCLKCMGPNEYFACGGACDNVCATLSQQEQNNCPIINIQCNRMCYCEEGYARDDNNICIPIDECKAPQCGENERYEECPALTSQPQTCSDVGFQPKCPSNDCSGQSGKPGCICVDGYARDYEGKCIPRTDCPSCGGDPNAVSGCGVYCNKRCSDIGHEPRFCIDICYENACDCKEGYYLDENTFTCVLPEQCTPTCGANEVYSTCVNGGCDMRYCSQLGRPTICIDPLECYDGCVCADGYLRDSNGVCVPESQCGKCNGPHQYFSCGSACDNVCWSSWNRMNCPIKTKRCTERCYCDDGYAWDENDNCIPINECPRTDTTSSEEMTDLPTTESTSSEEMMDMATTETPRTNSPVLDEEQTRALADQGITNFSNQLLYQTIKQAPTKSSAISGYSVSILLALITLCAQDSARIQLLNALGLSTNEQIETAYQEMIKSIGEQQFVQVSEALKLYVNDNYQLNNTFKYIAQNDFGADIESVDFANAQETADIINEYVAEETHDKIQNLVDSSMFNEDTRLALVNAIYLKANWSKPFEAKNTKDGIFYGSVSNTTVSMMNQRNPYVRYGEDAELNAQILMLPYLGGNFSLTIILPRESNKANVLETVAQKIASPNKWSSVNSNLAYNAVDITIPKITLETTTDMKKLLEMAGVDQIFDPYYRPLSGLTTDNATLFVSNAVQKVYLKIDEAGTEAAAATVFVGARATAVQVEPEYINFIANHPYLLYLSFRGTPFFSAVYCGSQY